MSTPFSSPPAPDPGATTPAYGSPAGYGPPPGRPPSPTRDANLALLFGLLSFVLAIFAGVPAIVFGVKGIRRAKVSGEGRGRSWFGLVSGVLGTLAFLAFVAYLVVSVAGVVERVLNGETPGATETAILEGEVQREVLEQDVYRRDRTDCDIVVPAEGVSTICEVDGDRYRVTFGDNLHFTVAPE